MISFFRKIRQKLLEQNKVTRYLVYALGEIILVVIGILIALSVNNKNTLNKEKALAEEYKVRLITQFQQDSLYLVDAQRNLKFFPSIIKQLDSLISPELNSKRKPDDIVKIIMALTLQAKFVSQTLAIGELNSTGNMSLFKNAALKDVLSSYQSQIANQVNFIQDSSDKIFAFDEYLMTHGKLDAGYYHVKSKFINDEFRNRYSIIVRHREEIAERFSSITKECHLALKLLRN